MIPAGASVFVATQPVDFREGASGLAALVRDSGADPFSGALYVFCSKRADRVKIVWWDGTVRYGTGVCLFAKRLDEHGFHWPRIENSVIRLSSAQLLALVEGMDRSRVKAVEARCRSDSCGEMTQGGLHSGVERRIMLHSRAWPIPRSSFRTTSRR
jgi:transposase